MSRVLPILFNTDMVRAILDGRKTVTRRVIKPQPAPDLKYKLGICVDGDRNEIGKFAFGSSPCGERMHFVRPPCLAGDILYVRETWQHLWELDGNEQIIDGTEKYYYAATDTIPFDTYVDSMGVTHYKIPWRPSIHMPKKAARIWLRVTDVRVERLQNINDNEAKKEGFPLEKEIHYIGEGCQTNDFAELWDSTIKKSDIDLYGWDANPWVWVIEFERCEKPEDRYI